jgi:hypothetical protein
VCQRLPQAHSCAHDRARRSCALEPGHPGRSAPGLRVGGGRCPDIQSVARVRPMPSEQEAREPARDSSLWQLARIIIRPDTARVICVPLRNVPRLYDSTMVTQITLNTEPHGFESCQGDSYDKSVNLKRLNRSPSGRAIPNEVPSRREQNCKHERIRVAQANRRRPALDWAPEHSCHIPSPSRVGIYWIGHYLSL